MEKTAERFQNIPDLVDLCKAFFFKFGTRKLLGSSFFNAIKSMEEKNGQDLFSDFLAACGHKGDAAGFLMCLLLKIQSSQGRKIVLNGIEIPRLFLYFLLENRLPGNRLHRIKNVAQLKKLGVFYSDEGGRLQEVIDRYPVRLSDHIIRQSMVSNSVKQQYIPFEQELDSIGKTITFDGHFKNGLLEQMYENRVIFLLDMHCPVYCRFCFRKHKSDRNTPTPGIKDVQRAIAHVACHESIQEILITGGEPFLNRTCLETAIKGLIEISHVNTIRIATRSMVYYPDLFLKNNREYMDALITWNRECSLFKKRIEIGIHLVHPDEISLPTLECISFLVKKGIQVYVQTPFLGGINTDGKDLAKLFVMLRQAGAQIYYIFTPCHTIHGTRTYWAPISQSIAAVDYLRNHVSDRCIPKLCTATALGKIEWQSSGWAVEKDTNDSSFTWIRTPYSLEYFEPFVQAGTMPEHRVNSEGTLDAKFQLDMGDPSLYYGERKLSIPKKAPMIASKDSDDNGRKKQRVDANLLMERLYSSQNESSSVLPVPCSNLCRPHLTRVETSQMDASFFSYLSENPDITDIVFFLDDVSDKTLFHLSYVTAMLKTFDHVVCLRIRSRILGLFPENFTKRVIEWIAGLVDFSISNPFLLEMETWFLSADQISETHLKRVKALIDKGVNVYANVPMIHGINDHPKDICRLALALRKAKIEFHHFYVGGLKIQQKTQTGMDPAQVIDIASQVRIHCSGRQIPLYIVQTPYGEEEFGRSGCSQAFGFER